MPLGKVNRFSFGLFELQRRLQSFYFELTEKRIYFTFFKAKITMYTPINQWAEDDRPREKLLLKGKSALSDSELLAILIGSGSRNESAVRLCQRILASVNNNLNQLGKLSVHQLMQFK